MHFQRMCSNIGVDPLASNKGFWAELLGVGDFYYELGIQIIDACMATRARNGGLIEIGELMRRVERMRGKANSQVISEWMISSGQLRPSNPLATALISSRLAIAVWFVLFPKSSTPINPPYWSSRRFDSVFVCIVCIPPGQLDSAFHVTGMVALRYIGHDPGRMEVATWENRARTGESAPGWPVLGGQAGRTSRVLGSELFWERGLKDQLPFPIQKKNMIYLEFDV
ncbi:EAP30/Vps36 family-domain-containing protein [Jimgerdemannia flammicorona]|uniref:EAP30/Vps36 family-domain-containing protein n=1 Tax=Jimgerdemannia flammicorona TaxID=994334 RepID=A0A433QND4_9FUNG|nr:EAP30/Vps36 family-domain-containing protein [Jimgerdemannia flammicorona]